MNNEYHKSLTLKEAELLALKILKQVMEEKLDCKMLNWPVLLKMVGSKFTVMKTDAIIKELNAQATDEDTVIS